MAESWKTYAELAKLHGLSGQAVRHLVRRRGWRTQVGNDKLARVLVPDGEPLKVKVWVRTPSRTHVRRDAREQVQSEESNRFNELQAQVLALTERTAKAEGRAEEQAATIARLDGIAADLRKRLQEAQQAAEARRVAEATGAAERASWSRWKRLRAAWRRR